MNKTVIEVINLTELVNEHCLLLKNKLPHLNSNDQLFKLFILETSEEIPEEKNFLIIDDLKIGKSEVFNKIEMFITMGNLSSLNFQSVLTPIKKKDAKHLLFAKMLVTSSETMSVEIDYIRKYEHNVQVGEFLLGNYKVKNYSHQLPEIHSSWENGINGIALSLHEYQKSPRTFIKERILKWNTVFKRKQ